MTLPAFLEICAIVVGVFYTLVMVMIAVELVSAAAADRRLARLPDVEAECTCWPDDCRQEPGNEPACPYCSIVDSELPCPADLWAETA